MTVTVRQHIQALRDFSSKLEPYLLAVSAYYQNLDADESAPPRISCTQYAYLMASEFYISALSDTQDGLQYSAAASARTLMEVCADMNHIYHDEAKSTERAKKYVDSIAVFRKEAIRVGEAVYSGQMTRLKHLNPWTSSTIESRISKFGDASLGIYDYLSYSAHANPAVISFYQIPPLRDGLEMVISATAIQYMLALMQMAVFHGEAQGVTIELAQQLQEEFSAIEMPEPPRRKRDTIEP